MKKSKLFITALLTSLGLSALTGCQKGPWKEPDMSRTYEKIDSSSLYVKKVENLSDDFIMGMDVSSVIAEENSGVKYYNFEGKETDLLEVLSYSGINYIRVRIWNNPFNANGRGYGGGNCDLQTAIAIGKRATKYKMRLLVDFHYSDFWADPGKQMVPKAWKGMSQDELKVALYEFTRDSLKELQKNNIAVGMVQIGNETNGGKMAGINTGKSYRFSSFSMLFNEGSRAVREVYPDALVACHFANPENTKDYLNWASYLERDGVDYDVFGSSYYPFWHGTLENLSSTLDTIAKTYNKKVMILETSYAYTDDDTDFSGNSAGKDSYKMYPFSVAGQTNHVRNMVDLVANHMTNGIGVCYWEGAWITVGSYNPAKKDDREYQVEQWTKNSAIWEEYGSGWTASYAGEYDAEDAAGQVGGSAVDNQAFFDYNGKPLESLKVWNLVRFGNDAPKYIDGAEDAYMTKYTYEDFTLPETVNFIYNTNEKLPSPVTWEAFDIEAAKALGNNTYDIKGISEGKEVYCHLTIMEKNFLENYSFEDEEAGAWKIINNNTSKELDDTSYQAMFAKKGKDKNNPVTGDGSFHFWVSSANTLNVNLEQTLVLEASGEYKMQFTQIGGGNGNARADTTQLNCYAYAKTGNNTYKQDFVIMSYGDGFLTVKLNGIQYNAGDELTVGVHLESTEANVWGDIDDFMLNLVL